MAYDEFLTERMRRALAQEAGVVEKRMMGGVCFMVNDHMVGGAHREKNGEQRFMFRVGKPNMERALMNPKARSVSMAGRTMGGFVYVDASDCDDEALEAWLALCVAFTRTLPAKRKGK